MNAAFQALADPTRREILRLLRQRSMTAGDLALHFDLAKSTLSGHFHILRDAGLIVSERKGASIIYSLNTSVVESLLTAFFELLNVGQPTPPRRSREK